jgi:PAS domain S-box-containing protein
MQDSYTAIEGTKALLHDSTLYYMVSIGMDSNFSYVNAHYANNFSYISGSLVGMPYNCTMHPDDMNICKEVGELCFANPGQSFPATIRKHNGRDGYLVTQWNYRLITRDGVPEGVFCIGHDVTEFEAQKQDLKKANESLDNSKQILTQVAYDQSHIVRAPLANILGLVGILKSMPLNSNLSSIVAMLDKSSARLDDVVRNTIISVDNKVD